MIAQNGAPGSVAMASGYTTNTKPGPTGKKIEINLIDPITS